MNLEGSKTIESAKAQNEENNNQPSTQDSFKLIKSDGVQVLDSSPEEDVNGGRCFGFRNKSISILKKVKANWIKYHLLWLLILAIIIGTAWPLPGRTLGDAKLGSGLCLLTTNDTAAGPQQICVWQSLSSLSVTFIFLISGLQLKLDKMKRAFMARRAILVGYLLIFVITTAFSFAVAAGPKLDPPEFSFGIALFLIVPTTLSSCIVIVGYAKGDTALALLLSVTTNLIGVAFLPLTVTWMVSVFYAGSSQGATEAQVDAVDLCLSLVFTVLIPLLLGCLLRRFDRVAKVIDKLTFTFKVTSATLLAIIPWMRISQSADTFSQVSGGSYVVFIITGIAMHIWFLVLCYGFSMLTMPHISKEDVEKIKCLTLVCCQKTLPVSLSVLELLPTSSTGNPGLVALSMVLLHLIQTLMDSMVALKWASYSEKATKKTESSTTSLFNENVQKFIANKKGKDEASSEKEERTTEEALIDGCSSSPSTRKGDEEQQVNITLGTNIGNILDNDHIVAQKLNQV